MAVTEANFDLDLVNDIGLRSGEVEAVEKHRNQISAALSAALAQAPPQTDLPSVSGQRPMGGASDAIGACQAKHWKNLFDLSFGAGYRRSVEAYAGAMVDKDVPPAELLAAYGKTAINGVRHLIDAQMADGIRTDTQKAALQDQMAAYLGIIFKDAALSFGGYVEARARIRVEKELREQAHEREKLNVVVAALSRVARDLANKELGTRPVYDLPAEYEELGRTVDSVVASYWGAIRSVGDVVLELQNDIQGIAQDVAELANRTATQASNLEESAGALHRVNESSGANEAAAKSVAELAFKSDEQTQKSSGAIAEAMEAMTSLETSSKRITQVVGLIDGIATQTNLLALNAGVEAARAGTAGSGFSVVAQEVRALSTRCLSAATEIKGLVSESASYIGSGVGLVREAQDNLTNAVGTIGETDKMSAQIATKVSEQGGALRDIDAAVSSLGDITHRNAEMVVQTEARIESLSERINLLAEEFRAFNLEVQVVYDRPTKIAV